MYTMRSSSTSVLLPSSPPLWIVRVCFVSGSAAEAYTSTLYSYARDVFAARANVPVLSPSR